MQKRFKNFVFEAGAEEKTNKFMVQTPIWDFFKKMTTKTGDVRAVCVVCQKSLRFHNTSVMVRHLRFLHPKAYENYRNEYIQGRMGVGYHIRGGILGLPLTAPRRTRLKKERSEERKSGFKEEVKKLIVLKAKTKKEESCVITEKDLQQLGQGNIKILNISNKGTIPDVMGEQIIEDLKKGKTCVAMSRFEGGQEEEIENVDTNEEEEFSLKEGRQYKFVQVPAEYLEYLKGNGTEIADGSDEATVKEGTEVIQILDEGDTVVEAGEQSDSELLQIWEQLSPQHGVLVCSMDPNSRRQAADAAGEEGSSEEVGQVEFIIAN
ncbi:hypothetical protein RUM44_009663 [Polyplax serrata]|uniref:BED-type domain-containing protein n=1 Tax=Polyplax serrata TaxID=468196 RepID=A0ABR1ATX8_POLSC